MVRSNLRRIVAVGAVAIFIILLWLAVRLPMPLWVLAIPAFVFAMLQILSFRTRLTGDAADWAFVVGDYVYYLVVGVVLGLGSLVLENADVVSERFDANERASKEQQLDAAIIQIETTEAEIVDQRSEVAERRRELSRANERRAELGPDDYFACQENEIERINREFLDLSPNDFRFFGSREGPLLGDPCLAVEGALLGVPRASDRLRSDQDRLDQLHRIKSDAEIRRDDLRHDLGLEADGNAWFWERLSPADRESLLFEWFPMLLLIGIAIKIGKTTDALLSKFHSVGKGQGKSA